MENATECLVDAMQIEAKRGEAAAAHCLHAAWGTSWGECECSVDWTLFY